MAHSIREEMYSLEGVIVRPCSSTAFSSLNTDNTVAMLRYRHEIAICLPGQILEQKTDVSMIFIFRWVWARSMNGHRTHSCSDSLFYSKNVYSPTTEPKSSCRFTDIRVQTTIFQESFRFKLERLRIILLVMCDCPERISWRSFRMISGVYKPDVPKYNRSTWYKIAIVLIIFR